MRMLPFRVESKWTLCLIFLFTIVAVTLQDAGNGSCYVLQGGEVPIRECDPFVYKEGGTLHLPCHNLTSLYPAQDASNVEWSKDGSPLNNYGEFNFTKSNLQISDSGDYLCRVGNQHSFSHKVLVGRQPSREPPTPRCTSRYIGTYTCSWSNEHMYNTNLPTRYQLQFCQQVPSYKCETEYVNASSEGDPVTVVVNSTRARFFVSLCVANCLGQAISPGSSMVAPVFTSVPLPPRHVRMVPISVDQMNVSFDTPFLWEEEDVDYRYQFIQERTSFARWENAMTSDTINNTFVVDVADGKSFSKVCIKVAAYHKHKHPLVLSEYTTPVCSYTQMTAPSVGPPHFTSCIEPDDQQSELRKVNFTWEHLSPDEANGIIIKYTLILSITSPATNASKAVFNISPSDHFFLAEGVRSHCEYRAELYAENAAGQSPPSVNTVSIGSEAGVLSIQLLLILILLLSFGFLVAGFRLFFSIKKRVLPQVPEPFLNSQLLRMKMESSIAIVEKEVFDELHCQREISSTSTSIPANKGRNGYFQDKTLVQSLLENKEEHAYVKVDPVCLPVIPTKGGGYVTWK